MHVLVTGATGYIGGRLVPTLLEAGHDVRCLARDPNKLQDRWRDQVEVVEIRDRIPDYYGRYVTKEHVLSVFIGNKDGLDGFTCFVLKKVADLT